MKSDPVAEMRYVKQDPSQGICIPGSGSIVAQLAPESLTDETSSLDSGGPR
ncbi:MAG TPA: hypothetical protein VNV41_03880 [Candidatus Acidoferrales bacterium]|nr:hypothetical protein [Candidatus Acidoferrales bacterium]